MACAFVNEVFRQTSDIRTRFALMLGAVLEGTSLCGPWPSGDHNLAHGPFQIREDVWHVSKAQANDPAFAVNFALHKLNNGGYAQTVANQGELWIHDPLLAAAQAVYQAESPLYFYPADRIRAALAAIVAAGVDLGGLGIRPQPQPDGDGGRRIPLPGGLPGVPVPNLPGLPGVPDPRDIPGVGPALSVADFLGQLGNPAFWRNRVLPFGIGLIAVAAGIWFLLPESVTTVVVSGATRGAA